MTVDERGQIPHSVPHTVRDETISWEVRRAWPDRRGVAFEASRPDAGHVRAGYWHEDGSTVLHPVGDDPRLPGLGRSLGVSGQVISHRPGRRAVIRSVDGTTYAKVVRPGRGAALAEAVDRSAPFARIFTTPEVLAAADDVLMFSAVPGDSLLSLAAEADDSVWATAWRTWSDMWTATVKPPDDSDVAPHDATAEAGVMDSWIDKARPMLPAETLDVLVRVAATAKARLTGGSPARVVTAHRDLHDQQLLWSPPEQMALLDVDTCAPAEAALDLGNLRAHISWRAMQGLYSPEQAATARAEVDKSASDLGVPPSRVADYELATSVRLVCVYAFRPPWRENSLRLAHQLAGPDRLS